MRGGSSDRPSTAGEAGRVSKRRQESLEKHAGGTKLGARAASHRLRGAGGGRRGLEQGSLLSLLVGGASSQNKDKSIFRYCLELRSSEFPTQGLGVYFQRTVPKLELSLFC